MRSDLVFGALIHVPGRYQLCQLAAHAVRKLHKPKNRIEDTTNDVLRRFRKASPVAEVSTRPKQAEFPGKRLYRTDKIRFQETQHLDLAHTVVNRAALVLEGRGV